MMVTSWHTAGTNQFKLRFRMQRQLGTTLQIAFPKFYFFQPINNQIGMGEFAVMGCTGKGYVPVVEAKMFNCT